MNVDVGAQSDCVKWFRLLIMGGAVPFMKISGSGVGSVSSELPLMGKAAVMSGQERRQRASKQLLGRAESTG